MVSLKELIGGLRDEEWSETSCILDIIYTVSLSIQHFLLREFPQDVRRKILDCVDEMSIEEMKRVIEYGKDERIVEKMLKRDDITPLIPTILSIQPQLITEEHAVCKLCANSSEQWRE